MNRGVLAAGAAAHVHRLVDPYGGPRRPQGKRAIASADDKDKQKSPDDDVRKMNTA
jgi:hypothetical protein